MTRTRSTLCSQICVFLTKFRMLLFNLNMIKILSFPHTNSQEGRSFNFQYQGPGIAKCNAKAMARNGLTL